MQLPVWRWSPHPLGRGLQHGGQAQLQVPRAGDVGQQQASMHLQAILISAHTHVRARMSILSILSHTTATCSKSSPQPFICCQDLASSWFPLEGYGITTALLVVCGDAANHGEIGMEGHMTCRASLLPCRPRRLRRQL